MGDAPRATPPTAPVVRNQSTPDRTIERGPQHLTNPLHRRRRQRPRPHRVRPQQRRERRLHLPDRQLRYGEPTQPRLQIVTDQLPIQPACRRAKRVPRRQPHIQPLAHRHQRTPRIHVVTQPEPPRTFRRSPRREPATLHPTTATVPASRQLNREIPPPVTTLTQPRTTQPPSATIIRIDTTTSLEHTPTRSLRHDSSVHRAHQRSNDACITSNAPAQDDHDEMRDTNQHRRTGEVQDSAKPGGTLYRAISWSNHTSASLRVAADLTGRIDSHQLANDIAAHAALLGQRSCRWRDGNAHVVHDRLSTVTGCRPHQFEGEKPQDEDIHRRGLAVHCRRPP